jgi:hypothetical protein
MPTPDRIEQIVNELAPVVHDDGTGALRRAVERELRGNPDATVAQLAKAVRDEREDAEIWLQQANADLSES